MKWSPKPTVYALLILSSLTLLMACQGSPSPATTIVTAKAITPDAQCGVYEPILLSEADELTALTEKMIVDHNNIYFCACASKRPPDFNLSVCKV